MSEEDKKEATIERKLFGEARGEYTTYEGTKVCKFNFPINNTLEENLSTVNYIAEELVKGIEARKKQAEEKKPDEETQE